MTNGHKTRSCVIEKKKLSLTVASDLKRRKALEWSALNTLLCLNIRAEAPNYPSSRKSTYTTPPVSPFSSTVVLLQDTESKIIAFAISCHRHFEILIFIDILDSVWKIQSTEYQKACIYSDS